MVLTSQQCEETQLLWESRFISSLPCFNGSNCVHSRTKSNILGLPQTVSCLNAFACLSHKTNDTEDGGHIMNSMGPGHFCLVRALLYTHIHAHTHTHTHTDKWTIYLSIYLSIVYAFVITVLWRELFTIWYIPIPSLHSNSLYGSDPLPLSTSLFQKSMH